MALINTWFFTKTKVNWDIIAKATHNKYKVKRVTPYIDKKGVFPNGYNLVLEVLEDEFDYGIDKTGVPRDDNVGMSFNVTVFSRDVTPKKKDIIALYDFDDENSYVMKFDMILRFHSMKILHASGEANA